MWSISLQHFLDDKGSTSSAPPEAKELADYFGTIVAAVTLDFSGLKIIVPGLVCRDHQLFGCSGAITGYLAAREELDTIGWYCTKCDNSGVITGWEGTIWDCTDQTLAHGA